MEASKAPVVLGALGFVGYEGLFIFERANAACRESKGLHLTYYGNYNSSWFDPEPLNCRGLLCRHVARNCTTKVGEVNSSFYTTCEWPGSTSVRSS